MSVLCKSTLHNTLITWAWDACALGFWLMSLTLVIMSIRVYDPSLTPLYPQRLRFSPGTLFWDSFTNHNTGNYSRHCIDITTNQRFSPIFRFFSEGGGGRGSVHRWSWWAEQNYGVAFNPLCPGINILGSRIFLVKRKLNFVVISQTIDWE